MEIQINLGILLCAIIALVFSFIELRSYKAKESSKLLSQLNKRYMESNDIQCVVKYLRNFEASDDVPSAFQVEVFLRYFEELGAHLEKKSLNPEYAYTFFSFYIKQFYETNKGKNLQKMIHDEDKELNYLKLFIKKIKEYEYKVNKIKQ